jgi:hypothetical protein
MLAKGPFPCLSVIDDNAVDYTKNYEVLIRKEYGGLRMDDRKPLRLAFWLIVTSLLLGSLAGGFNRTLVEMPAWRHLGPEAWAAFSRLADLGNGKIIYPVAGIGGTILTLAAAIAFRFSRRRPLSVAIPVYGAALMDICVLLLTTQAAPIMLSLRREGTNPQLLQKAFEGFFRWDSIRAVFGTLGDCAAIWSLVAVTVVSVKCENHPAKSG